MSKRRQKRVADLVQRELSDIVLRRIKDPRLVGLTITGTRVSPDFMYADIHFYRLGGDPAELEEARQGLESACGYIRRELGARLHIRHTPELRFHLDESIDYGAHIESLLAQLRTSQPQDEGTAPDGTASDETASDGGPDRAPDR
ncbi:MAG: 30S ribosome-binding factor RbfA [Anaerolineae bacterium]|nr:30S ribosome-binding factor RbfA [Anaerolineae bacterium]